MNITIEPGEESPPTTCDCCGNQTKTIWGYAYENDSALAAYFVQWTSGRKDHYPNFDFLIGTWGDESVNDKVLVSWVYNATHEHGGSYMVIDSTNRPAASSNLCSRALSRNEVINNGELIGISKEILDAIWVNDPRIEEITNFGKGA